MANERRLIDANALPVTTLTDGGYWTKDVVYKKNVDAAPTIDAVEVVRCEDCVYWTTEGNGYFEDEPHCGNPYGIEGYPKRDDFCSRGIRMSGTQPQKEDA